MFLILFMGTHRLLHDGFSRDAFRLWVGGHLVLPARFQSTRPSLFKPTSDRSLRCTRSSPNTSGVFLVQPHSRHWLRRFPHESLPRVPARVCFSKRERVSTTNLNQFIILEKWFFPNERIRRELAVLDEVARGVSSDPHSLFTSSTPQMYAKTCCSGRNSHLPEQARLSSTSCQRTGGQVGTTHASFCCSCNWNHQSGTAFVTTCFFFAT